MTDSLLGDCALDSMPLLAFGVRVPDLACYHSSQRFYTGQSHACLCRVSYLGDAQLNMVPAVVCIVAAMHVCTDDAMTWTARRSNLRRENVHDHQ